MKIRSNTFEMGDAIPERCAYGRKGGVADLRNVADVDPVHNGI